MAAPDPDPAPLEASDLQRARALNAKIRDRVSDVRRHLLALCTAMAEFGDEGRGSATMTHMELVGIREMRQNLSRYAQRARHGESFLITDRGQEVAQLTPAPGRASAIDRLVAERGAMRGQGNLLDVLEELPVPIAGPPSSEVLDELRSERL
jgi:prevent-host-death family protein